MLNTLFYEYVDDSEKELVALEATTDIEIEKQMLAMEYADRVYNIKLQQANLKLLNENGTYDDMFALYEAAAKENTEKKKGFLASAFDAVINFINSLIDKVKKIFSSEKEKEIKEKAGNNKAQIKDPNTVLGAIENALKSAASFLMPGFTKQNDAGEKVFSASKTLTTAIEGAATVSLTGALIWKNKEKFVGLLSKAKGYVGKAKDGLSKLAGDESAIGEKILGFMKDITKSVSGAISSCATAISQAISGVVDKVTGKNRAEAPAETEDEETVQDDEFEESQEFTEACDEIIDLIDSL